MKKFIFILLPLITLGQYPIHEEYDPGTSWVFTNGAGIQNYGGAENWATFNIGTTPYPNNSTVTITSPMYDLSNCSSNVDISYEIRGIIEDGYDSTFFEYWDGFSWTQITSYIGQVITTEMFSIPNTVTQFRFRLITDATVNTYTTFPPPTTNVYYYDVNYPHTKKMCGFYAPPYKIVKEAINALLTCA